MTIPCPVCQMPMVLTEMDRFYRQRRCTFCDERGPFELREDRPGKLEAERINEELEVKP